MRKFKYTESQVPPSLTVHVYHEREPWLHFDKEGGSRPCSIYNGCTVARLIDVQTGDVKSEGVAYCNLNRDNPNRKIGRAIAVGRALKNYFSYSQQQRKEWASAL